MVGGAEAAPEQQPARADQRLRHQVPVAVERDRPPARHLQVDLEMVLQVGADAGPVGDDRDAVLAQVRRRADARQHEERRRVDRGCGEHDLGVRPDPADRPAALIFDADRPAALHDDAAHMGPRPQLQVAALQRRLEIGVGGGPAAALPHRHLHCAKTFLALAVIVVGRRVAGLLAGVDEGAVERVLLAPAGDVERAVAAAPPGLPPVRVFHAPVVGQHVPVAPARRAQRLPVVEVAGMAAHVDHAVDRGRAADHLAARRGQPPSPRWGSGSVSKPQS